MTDMYYVSNMEQGYIGSSSNKGQNQQKNNPNFNNNNLFISQGRETTNINSACMPCSLQIGKVGKVLNIPPYMKIMKDA